MNQKKPEKKIEASPRSNKSKVQNESRTGLLRIWVDELMESQPKNYFPLLFSLSVCVSGVGGKFFSPLRFETRCRSKQMNTAWFVHCIRFKKTSE
mmetsp:Transcript_10513/g.20412  ORF Transcript_10513/g.20412 Transcript_10513/m.20412 type:complete len:95 (-) Transcript_10513:1117-1401(-)